MVSVYEEFVSIRYGAQHCRYYGHRENYRLLRNMPTTDYTRLALKRTINVLAIWEGNDGFTNG